jgi:hypothetical protein
VVQASAVLKYSPFFVARFAPLGCIPTGIVLLLSYSQLCGQNIMLSLELDGFGGIFHA